MPLSAWSSSHRVVGLFMRVCCSAYLSISIKFVKAAILLLLHLLGHLSDVCVLRLSGCPRERTLWTVSWTPTVHLDGAYCVLGCSPEYSSFVPAVATPAVAHCGSHRRAKTCVTADVLGRCSCTGHTILTSCVRAALQSLHVRQVCVLGLCRATTQEFDISHYLQFASCFSRQRDVVVVDIGSSFHRLNNVLSDISSKVCCTCQFFLIVLFRHAAVGVILAIAYGGTEQGLQVVSVLQVATQGPQLFPNGSQSSLRVSVACRAVSLGRHCLSRPLL